VGSAAGEPVHRQQPQRGQGTAELPGPTDQHEQAAKLMESASMNRNMLPRTPPRNHDSGGYSGVQMICDDGYEAVFYHDGERVLLGVKPTFDEAWELYREARQAQRSGFSQG